MNSTPENPETFALHGRTILIIDDEPANLRMLSTYLEDAGLQVLAAQDGENGLERAWYAQPDLILLDVMLGKIDGFEICRRLKAGDRTSKIPVIFITALAEPKDKVKGFEAGGVDYIIKPFQAEEVIARVTAHLRIRVLARQLEEARQNLERQVEVRTAELVQVNQKLQQEIAERQRVEKTLAEERNLLRTLIENLPDFIYVKDTASRFLLANITTIRSLGASTLEEVLGKTDFDFHPPELARQYWADEQAIFRSGQPLLGHEEPVVDRRSKNPIRWLSTTKAPLRDSQGHIVGLVGMNRDITERKQAEAEREALIAELEAKNAELERFTYTVSHDLKSPLITIQGFLGFLEQAALTGQVERVKGDVARITNAVSKMQQLLDELLEFSRIGRLVNPPEQISLTSLVHEAVNMVAGRLAERGIEVEIAPGLPQIYGDRARLREVFENLVDNAAKYMGDQPHPRIEIGVREDGPEPAFFVRDNGVGIESRYQHKIFELFEKLNQKSEGAGVGLAIVKRIVEMHDGRIWVESEGAGKGSAFCFTLATGERSVQKPMADHQLMKSKQ